MAELPPNPYRERLVRFYKHYEPAKLADVESLLTKAKGKEEQLFAKCVAKYGPEPPEEEKASPSKTTKPQTPTASSVPAAPKTLSEVLAEGEWVEKDDVKSGKKYYYNKKSKETTWDLVKKLGLSTAKPAAAAAAPAKPPASSTTGGAADDILDVKPASSSASSAQKEESSDAAVTTPRGAEDKTEEVGDVPSAQQLARLKDFYQKQGIEKLDSELIEAMEGWKGREEEMFQALAHKYNVPYDGPLPDAGGNGDQDGTSGADNVGGAGAGQGDAAEKTLGKIEDFVQSLIGRAALPADSNTAESGGMSAVSTGTLLQMLGCEGGPFVSKAPQPAIHPSHTRLSLLSRLSDEFKMKRTKMQDAFEDVVDEKRKNHSEKLRTMQKDHEEKLAEIRERYTNMAAAKRQLAAEQAAAEATAENLTLTNESLVGTYNPGASLSAAETDAYADEIAMLERRILQHGGNQSASSATVSARRLLAFWKTKYENLCTAFEQQQEQHFMVKGKLEEANSLIGQNARNLQGIVAVLRDREQKERHRGEQLKAAYLKECTRRQMLPREPEVHASQIAGSQMSHTKLMMIAQHGYDAVMSTENGQTGRAIDALDGSGINSSSTSTNAVAPADAKTFTKLGAKSPALVRSMHETIIDRKEECRMMEISIQENDRLIEDVSQRLEVEQANYAKFVAQVHGPAASLLEEAIELTATIDRLGAQKHETECAKLRHEVKHATEKAELVEAIERARAQGREHEDELHRDMREKEIDMVRIRGKINSGQSITVADFSDAPVKDPKLKLDVLRSQLSVLDSERQILRSQLSHARAAEFDVMTELEERLRIPPADAKRK